MNRADIEARCIEDGDCLIWTGGCCGDHPSGRYEGKTQLIRRVLWAKENGPIPEGMVLRATCGNPKCLAKSHTALMTRSKLSKSLGSAAMGGRVRTANIAKAWHSRPGRVLSWTMVDELRASPETGAQLARRTGLTESLISKVRKYKTWKPYSTPFAGLGARA